MFPPGGTSRVNTTLCVAPENCHKTLVPGAIVTSSGVNALPAVAIVTPGPPWVTVTVAVAVCVTPFAVSDAVIVAVPGVTPETRPVDVTDAVPGALDVKVAGGNPVIDVPVSFSGVAVNCAVAPTPTVGVGGRDRQGGIGAAAVPPPCTITVPVIPPCRLHSYE